MKGIEVGGACHEEDECLHDFGCKTQRNGNAWKSWA